MRKPGTLVIVSLCLCALALLAACRRAAKRPPASPAAQPIAGPVVTADPAPGPTAAPTDTPAPTATLRHPGRLVAIDPGHGGEDLGARHFNLQEEMDLHESTVTLQLALRIGEKLKARGYGVYYTRDGDFDPNLYERDVNGDGETNLRDVVQTRTDLVNESGADLLLSLHMNAWETDDEQLLRATGGIETYYCPDRPFGDQNLRFANLVHENIIAAMKQFGYGLPDRGVRIDHAKAWPDDPGHHLMILGPKDEIIVRPSNMPGVLSEPMFITCDAEAALMQRDDVQDALAEAYVKAIVVLLEEQ